MACKKAFIQQSNLPLKPYEETLLHHLSIMNNEIKGLAAINVSLQSTELRTFKAKVQSLVRSIN